MFDIALIAWLNPNHDLVVFWVMLLGVFGGLALGAFLIGRRLHRGGGFGPAYAYLGALTGLIVLGAILQLVMAEPAAPGPTGVLQAARVATGVYMLIVWVVVIWDSRSVPRSLREGAELAGRS